MITFNNSHLTELSPLRRSKLVPETLIEGSKYNGKTLQEITTIDPLFMSYIGSFINTEWSWPLLQCYKEKIEEYILNKNISTKEELDLQIRVRPKIYPSKPTTSHSKTSNGLTLNTPLRFGKHKGKTLKQLLTTDRNYVVWLAYKSKFKVDPEVKKALSR